MPSSTAPAVDVTLEVVEGVGVARVVAGSGTTVSDVSGGHAPLSAPSVHAAVMAFSMAASASAVAFRPVAAAAAGACTRHGSWKVPVVALADPATPSSTSAAVTFATSSTSSVVAACTRRPRRPASADASPALMAVTSMVRKASRATMPPDVAPSYSAGSPAMMVANATNGADDALGGGQAVVAHITTEVVCPAEPHVCATTGR